MMTGGEAAPMASRICRVIPQPRETNPTSTVGEGELDEAVARVELEVGLPEEEPDYRGVDRVKRLRRCTLAAIETIPW